MLQIKKIYGLITLMLLLSFTIGFAQVPEKPKTPLNFSASIKTEKGSNAVEFKWSKNPEGVTPSLYYVYYAPKYTSDLNKFKQLFSVNEEGKESYSYIKTLDAGEYTFYIVAALKSGGQVLYSDASDFVQLKVEKNNSESYIKFISSPPKDGKILLNTSWTYEVKVQTNLQGTIKFAFVGDVPEGMTIDETTGIISWTPTKEGKFTVLVKAYLESDPTKYAKQSITLQVYKEGEKENFIKITSKIPKEGKILLGASFTYDIEFETNLPGDFKFSFVGDVPEGMSIDENTGVISWTANKEGKFIITVKVYSVTDPTKYTKYQFYVYVYKQYEEKKPCAVISGSVVYEDNSVPTSGQVKAWLENGNKEAPKYSGKIDTDGKYTINVPEGTYFLQIEGGDFYKEYFENTNEVKNAVRFKMACDETKTVDFVVTKKAVPKKFTVTGNVSAESDGKALYALVEFQIVGTLNGSEKPGEKTLFTVKTDKDGNYSIELYDSYIYIARARPADKNSLYFEEFYNNVETSLEAEKINLIGNLDNINFTLRSLLTSEKGILNGTVVNSEGTGIKADIIAYLVYSAKNSEKKYIYKVETQSDDAGNFTLENMIYGEFVIMSVPSEKTSTPGYYALNDFAKKSWKDATKVNINSADNGTIKIKHEKRTGEKGVAGLRGKITQRDGMFGKRSNNPLSSNVLSGTFIYVTDNSGEVIDYGFSDALGEFYLSELMAGTLYITADKVGFEPEMATIITDYSDNSIIYNDLTLEPEGVAGVEELTYTSFGIAIYPNPASDFIRINNPNNIKVYGIRLLSIDGQTVYSSNDESNSSNFSINVQANAIGMFVLQLNTEKGTITQPIMILK